MRRRLVLYAAGVVFLVMISGVVGMAWFLMRPAAPEGAPGQIFVVPEGAGLSKVAAELERQGLIAGRGPLIIWGRVVGQSRSIKAGEYLLSAAMPPVKILDHLARGMILTHRVTIPEGVGIRDVARLLSERNLACEEEFIAFASDPKAAGQYGLEAPGLEGFLYPDTYRFSKGLPVKVIAGVMVDRFFEKVGPLREQIQQSGMSLEQVVILASVIEKETGSPPERPVIASVFLNRIRTGMRLQSDPTAVYDAEDFEGRITRSDLRRRSPYNTYVIGGLPIGPIGNPGLDAVVAVLEPAETDYFYFVSKNDGTHHFSKTLEEHNAAVRKYLRGGGSRAS